MSLALAAREANLPGQECDRLDPALNFGERSMTIRTRREAIGLLGAGVATAALAGVASAQEFPKGAVIRTVLKDYAPGELAGGATLFHEHMSLRDGFLADWTRYAAETRAANRAPNAPPP